MSVKARGGYQIVDFSNYVFPIKTPVSCPDVFEQILNCKNKPAVIANLKVDFGDDDITTIPDSSAMFTVSSDEVVGFTMTENLAQFNIVCNVVDKTVRVSTYTLQGTEDE